MAWTNVPRCVDDSAWPYGNHPQNVQTFWQGRNRLTPSDFEPLRHGIQNLPRDFLAANPELNTNAETPPHAHTSPWHVRRLFSRYLLESRWRSLPEEEMENTKKEFSDIKNAALLHHIRAEARRTGASELEVFPPHGQIPALCGSELLNELPDDVWSKILSQLECYDLITCREVSKRWHSLADGCISRLACFNYPLSFHVLRHTQWLEENGDFGGGRILTRWQWEGERLLKFLIRRCSNLQTLVTEFDITHMMEDVVKSCPQLSNICINLQGINPSTDLRGHSDSTNMATPIFTKLTGTNTLLLHDLGGGNRNFSLRVVSLAMPIKSHPGRFVRDASITNATSALLETCPNLKVLEMVGSFGLVLDELDIKAPLNLEYFTLWNDDHSMSTMASGWLAFLQKCPKLKALGMNELLGIGGENLMNAVASMDLEFISCEWHPIIELWVEAVGHGTRIDVYDVNPGVRDMIPDKCRPLTDERPPLVTHPDMAAFMERILSG
ncbi:hypothetical protein BSKO_08691 [Bryopsis sp. KO-2023]|nr:hypothetical protein BSKO_08691 [Bryopsis sp. KO-2023]